MNHKLVDDQGNVKLYVQCDIPGFSVSVAGTTPEPLTRAEVEGLTKAQKDNKIVEDPRDKRLKELEAEVADIKKKLK